jgi:hypothetical protein
MVADELRAFLVAQSFGRADVDLFLGGLPDVPSVPNTCIVVADSITGVAPQHVFGEDLPAFEMSRVQITTRGEPHDFLGPRRQIERIYQLLIRQGAQSFSSTRYLDISAIQSPHTFGRDEKHRWVFYVNFEVHKALSSTA